jgi:predicted TIM-barrel fold metal-dependent hydrolase
MTSPASLQVPREIPIVAIEEHYWDSELASHFEGAESRQIGPIEQRLYDFGGARLRDMDAAGIAKAVLSHGAPSGQRLGADIAVALIERVNNRLHAAVATNPDRFAAFAALPTAVPEAAADELERCVSLGFKGAMIHGLSNGEFIDLKKFWPIFARAEQLDVPIYLHPSLPHPDVIAAYYVDYMQDHPLFARPAWGFTVECATQAIRLMLSGVFERYPALKIILGHMGESLPYQLWRIDSALSRPGGSAIGIREIFTNNFWITTSGFFSTPALQCAVAEMGCDRIMFAVDWPFVADSNPGTAWINAVPLCTADKRKIMSDNARTLLRL